MLKIKKWKLIVSSIVVLSPIVVGLILWNYLPDTMLTHWGADGNADGSVAKAVAVFLLPILLLAFQWFALWITKLDKKQPEQNEKALGIIYWIIPALSVFVNGTMYAVALGREFTGIIAMPILFGLLFLYIGNYMPKVKQNQSLGIKISWTLNNEENWNKTHRFAGKVWVVGGLLILLTAFLPVKLMFVILMVVTFCLILLPVLYSYRIYRTHIQQGIDYTPKSKTKAERIAAKITAVIVPLILVGVAVIMFIGDITLSYGDEALVVDSTLWTESYIEYDTIKEIAYQDSGFEGHRISGFGSAKLSLGQFYNDDFGKYISYIYNSCDACVVIYGENQILILNGPDTESTKAIYDTLQQKIQ